MSRRPDGAPHSRPRFRTENTVALFAALETLLLLIRHDRPEVLFWWDAQGWPLVLGLWLRDLALAVAAFLAVRLLIRTLLAEPVAAAERTAYAVRLTVAAALAAVLLTGAGIALRWILPAAIPPGLWEDSVLDAEGVLRRPHGLPWLGGEAFGVQNRAFTSYVYLHYCGALFRAFGRGDVGFLALSAMGGTLMLPAAAWFAREVGGWRCAIGALGIAAFAQWPLLLSRWGWLATAMVTLLLLSAAAALAAVRTGRLSLAILSGLAAGLSEHTHPAAPAAFAGIGLFALLSLRRPERRRLVAAAFLAAFVALVPVGVFFLQHPGHFGGHPRDVSLLRVLDLTPGTTLRKAEALVGGLLSNVVLYAGIPLWTGDPNARHSLPGRSVVDPLLGVAALVGVAVGLERSRAGSEPHALLLWTAAGSLLAGILAYPVGAPNTLRACGFLGPLIVLCALGLDRAIVWLRPRVRARPAFLWALALAVVLAVETPVLLRLWPEDRRVQAAFCFNETAGGRIRRELADRETVLDPAVVRNPLVFEALAGGTDPSRPIQRIPRETVDEVLARRPPASFWMVTDARGFEAFARAGWRFARPVPLSQEFPEARIALVCPG